MWALSAVGLDDDYLFPVVWALCPEGLAESALLAKWEGFPHFLWTSVEGVVDQWYEWVVVGNVGCSLQGLVVD